VKSPNNNNIFLYRLLSPDTKLQDAMRNKMCIYSYNDTEGAKSVRIGHLVQSSTFAGNNPHGMIFWETLSKLVNEEPVHVRDRIMMAMLRSIGIEKGKPFKPTERQVKIFAEATLVGEAMARANDFAKRYMELAHYTDGVQWEFALLLDPSQESKYYTLLDERCAWFYEAATAAYGMETAIKTTYTMVEIIWEFLDTSIRISAEKSLPK
jgi:hypothetical protein